MRKHGQSTSAFFALVIQGNMIILCGFLHFREGMQEKMSIFFRIFCSPALTEIHRSQLFDPRFPPIRLHENGLPGN